MNDLPWNHYTSEEEAKTMGMTHHASYFLIPMWMRYIDDEEEILFCTKWYPMEKLFSFFYSIECFLQLLMFQPELAAHIKIIEEI